jgi:hypothetical protein
VTCCDECGKSWIIDLTSAASHMWLTSSACKVWQWLCSPFSLYIARHHMFNSTCKNTFLKVYTSFWTILYYLNELCVSKDDTNFGDMTLKSGNTYTTTSLLKFNYVLSSFKFGAMLTCLHGTVDFNLPWTAGGLTFLSNTRSGQPEARSVLVPTFTPHIGCRAYTYVTMKPLLIISLQSRETEQAV